MGRVVALLAAAVLALTLTGCGDDGAEPGASDEATLVLDFTPNAVHSGLYLALDDGGFERAGVELQIREPSASSDAPKLLEAGRADFAILDIHDLAIARERGVDIVGVAPIVQRPLAAVLATGDVGSPTELEGRTVGVTGLPSDDAVLDSVLEGAGADPDAVQRTTIGFEAVPALSAGRVDAATAFWNAEGVALSRLGVDTHEFRVDDFGAPRYPELVLTTSAGTLAERPDLVQAVVEATADGYDDVAADPGRGLDALTEAVPGLARSEQRAQLDALIDADALGGGAGFDERALQAWARWDAEHGIVAAPPRPADAFALDLTHG
jgi:NitT/TauT family transport system substrate-binding protein/putative hydroxymethylpyrimidine transport system substrate-binding protein